MAQFRRNARTGDILKTAFLVILTLALAFSLPDFRILAWVPLAAFLLPWCLRDRLVEHPGPALSGLRVIPIAAIVVSVAVGELELAEHVERILALVVWGVIGLAVGTFFWILSDERIVMSYDD